MYYIIITFSKCKLFYLYFIYNILNANFRPDTRDIDIPNVMETFPSKFSDSSVFQEAREVSSVIPATINVIFTLL